MILVCILNKNNHKFIGQQNIPVGVSRCPKTHDMSMFYCSYRSISVRVRIGILIEFNRFKLYHDNVVHVNFGRILSWGCRWASQCNVIMMMMMMITDEDWGMAIKEGYFYFEQLPVCYNYYYYVAKRDLAQFPSSPSSASPCLRASPRLPNAGQVICNRLPASDI